ncbi:MAG TPA: FAD-dependent oxidoreductase, partial [Leptospiraceae bacterium]|nr:FAD-dependent oxidoreductase [Leptospiraceae bacterium]
MGKLSKKLLIAAVIVTGFILFHHFHLQDYLSFEYLRQERDSLLQLYQSNEAAFTVSYFMIYVFSAAFSVPGATVLTLGAGALFGIWKGLLLVSFASTIGASLSFLVSRYMFRESIEKKFKDQMETVNSGIRKDGKLYLLSLRLVPAFPFFLINLLMGLTEISLGSFYAVSQIGMIPGTFVYVNAGTQLVSLNSPKDILSPVLMISFAALGMLPIAAKFFLSFLQNRRLYANYKKPDKFDYNIAVIGAGAAGLVTSYISAAVRAKTLLIEKNKMGGDCLNTGCVPSKTLLSAAKKIHLAKKAEQYGLNSAKIDFDFSRIMERVHSVIRKIEPNDSIERYSGLGVECIRGDAKLLSPFEIQIGERKITAKNIVIASGAEPFIPDIPGLKDVGYLSSETLWNLKKLPKTFLVAGAGAIGCELAQAFSRLGSKVVLVEAAERILPSEDAKLSSFLYEVFIEEGIEIIASGKILQFEKNILGKKAKIQCNDKINEIFFDEVLICTGRKARTEGFGLEELGIRLTSKGSIEVNSYLQTNYPNIFACGDAAGPFQLTHAAAHQAWYAAVNALFGFAKTFKADYRVMPRTVYTDPEIARVGISEKEALENGIEYEKTEYDIGELDRAVTEGEARGFIQVLTEKRSDRILGVTI